MVRVRTMLALCLLMVLTMSGCAGLGEQAGVAEVAEGRVERLDGAQWVATTEVRPGQVLRAATEAALRTPAATLRLRRGSTGTWEGGSLALDTGDVLVQNALDVPSGVGLSMDQVSIAGNGIYRLQSGVAPRLAVYAGGVEVTRPGEEQHLDALREIDLSSRRFDGTDGPLSYSVNDLFDQLLLADAIAFDAQITNLVNSIDATYGSQSQPADFYTSFVSVDAPDVGTLSQSAPQVEPDGRFGPPADALVGLFLARAAVDTGTTELPAAAATVRTLREEGARWGLVARSLGVTSVEFAGIVDRAVAQREESGAPPVAPPAPAPTSTGPATTAPPRPAEPALAPAAPSTPQLPPAPPPAVQPAPEVPPPSGPTGSGPVDAILEDVLDLVPAAGGLLGSDQ